MQHAFQLVSAPIYQPEQSVRNNHYRCLMKRFAYLVWSATRNVEPCHTEPHGLSWKSFACLPLYRERHDEAPADFAARYEPDIPVLIQSFQLWELSHRSTA